MCIFFLFLHFLYCLVGKFCIAYYLKKFFIYFARHLLTSKSFFSLHILKLTKERVQVSSGRKVHLCELLKDSGFICSIEKLPCNKTGQHFLFNKKISNGELDFWLGHFRKVLYFNSFSIKSLVSQLIE